MVGKSYWVLICDPLYKVCFGQQMAHHLHQISWLCTIVMHIWTDTKQSSLSNEYLGLDE